MTDITAAPAPSIGAAYFSVIRRALPLAIGTLVLSVIYFWLGPYRGPTFFFPLLIFAGLGLIWLSQAHKNDHRAMMRIDEPPVEGQWTAVAGVLVPTEGDEDPLAVRFKVFYPLKHETGSRHREPRLCCRYDGFYRVPMGVDTGKSVVPLLGFPDIENTLKRPMSDEMLKSAQAAATLCPRNLIRPVAQEITRSRVTDRVETILKYGDEPHETKVRTDSWTLKTGDEVCVFGLWKNGTLRRAENRFSGLPVHMGTAEHVRKDMGDLGKGFVWFAAVVFGLAAILAVYSLT
ncbi:MAG: hypothetical protein GY952_10815 [Rhodobacteraceae bacterium]|nr:hypothetical protein [Paracoccaceae bacterium]